MGDLVVVMQQGGRIAQAGAPADLLAQPASEYVARFVGADRGLKRLSLYRVADVRCGEAPLARIGRSRPRTSGARAERSGRPLRPARRRRDRPLGWVDASDLPRGRPAQRRPTPTPRPRCWTGAPRSRTPPRCCSTRRCAAASSSTGTGRVLGLLTARGGHGLPARRPLARGARGHRRGRGRGAGPSGRRPRARPRTIAAAHDRDPLGLDRGAPRRRRRQDAGSTSSCSSSPCWRASSSPWRWPSWRCAARAPSGR